MKYSIIGTNGFLSTVIGKYCNNNAIELVTFGLNAPKFHKCDYFYQVDFTKDEFPIEKLTDSDVIIYAAGAGIQNNLHEDIDLIYLLNVTIPVKICNALRVINYKGTFITFGSVFEIGETTLRHPFTEDDILKSTARATNDYTVSKRMLTKFVCSYNHKFTHWHFIIPTIYGENENPMRLIPYTVSAIKSGTKLNFTSGDQIREYIYIGELPIIIKLCIDKSIPSGVYNLHGNETLSVKDIVGIIHSAYNKNVPDNCFGNVNRSDSSMKYLALDGQKLYEFIKYTPKSKISDICLKY